MPDLTQEEILKFMDKFVRISKEELAQTGRILGTTFILTKKMEVGPWLRGSAVDPATMERMDDDGENPGENFLLCVPCLYDHAPTLLHMVKYLTGRPEKFDEVIEGNIAARRAAGVEDPYKDAVMSFCHDLQVTPKDIVAFFIRKVCRDTNASAYMKIDEAWTATSQLKDGETAEQVQARYASLEDHPDKRECMNVILETKTFRKFEVHMFERDSGHPDAAGYKTIKWGDVHSITDTPENQSLSGRFVNLLMPSQQHP